MRFRILQASRTTYDARLSVHKRSNPENKRMQPRSMHKPLAFSRVENELGKKYDERPLYNEQEVEIKKVMMIIMMILFRIKKVMMIIMMILFRIKKVMMIIMMILFRIKKVMMIIMMILFRIKKLSPFQLQ